MAESDKPLTVEKPSSKKETKLEPTFRNVGYPVFSMAVDDDDQLYCAGGGGNSRSGVVNAITCFKLQEEGREFQFSWLQKLPQDKGAVMNMDCISLATEDERKQPKLLACGMDEFCQVFEIGSDSLQLRSEFRTDFKEKKNAFDESYQKVCKFTHDQKFLITAGTDCIVRAWPTELFKRKSTKIESPALLMEQHEADVNDISCSTVEPSLIATCSAESLCWWDLSNPNDPLIKCTNKIIFQNRREKDIVFKFAMFGKGPSQHLLYSIELNKKRQAYLTQWNAQTKEILKFRLLHGKAVTAFAVSPKGDMLGYGTADGGVGIVSATNLRRLFYDKKAHGFTVTCAAFSNDGKNLMSGSADYSCRIYSTRSLRGGASMSLMTYLAVLVVILAYFIASQHLTASWFSGQLIPFMKTHESQPAIVNDPSLRSPQRYHEPPYQALLVRLESSEDRGFWFFGCANYGTGEFCRYFELDPDTAPDISLVQPERREEVRIRYEIDKISYETLPGLPPVQERRPAGTDKRLIEHFYCGQDYGLSASDYDPTYNEILKGHAYCNFIQIARLWRFPLHDYTGLLQSIRTHAKYAKHLQPIPNEIIQLLKQPPSDDSIEPEEFEPLPYDLLVDQMKKGARLCSILMRYKLGFLVGADPWTVPVAIIAANCLLKQTQDLKLVVICSNLMKATWKARCEKWLGIELGPVPQLEKRVNLIVQEHIHFLQNCDITRYVVIVDDFYLNETLLRGLEPCPHVLFLSRRPIQELLHQHAPNACCSLMKISCLPLFESDSMVRRYSAKRPHFWAQFELSLLFKRELTVELNCSNELIRDAIHFDADFTTNSKFESTNVAGAMIDRNNVHSWSNWLCKFIVQTENIKHRITTAYCAYRCKRDSQDSVCIVSRSNRVLQQLSMDLCFGGLKPNCIHLCDPTEKQEEVDQKRVYLLDFNKFKEHPVNMKINCIIFLEIHFDLESVYEVERYLLKYKKYADQPVVCEYLILNNSSDSVISAFWNEKKFRTGSNLADANSAGLLSYVKSELGRPDNSIDEENSDDTDIEIPSQNKRPSYIAISDDSECDEIGDESKIAEYDDDENDAHELVTVDLSPINNSARNGRIARSKTRSIDAAVRRGQQVVSIDIFPKKVENTIEVLSSSSSACSTPTDEQEIRTDDTSEEEQKDSCSESEASFTDSDESTESFLSEDSLAHVNPYADYQETSDEEWKKRNTVKVKLRRSARRRRSSTQSLLASTTPPRRKNTGKRQRQNTKRRTTRNK